MDKEALFVEHLDEADVEIRGKGTVRVRGLTRAEVIGMRKSTDSASTLDGPRALIIERKMIAKAMIDPELTEAEVGRWQAASAAGEMEPVVTAIELLSGLADDADKSGVPAV